MTTGWWDARPDQRPPSQPPALGAGFRGGTFKGRLVTIIGASGGLFVYSPTAAKGNLIESITAANGTDPYGNKYFAGTATYAASAGSSFVVNLLSTVNSAFFQYATPTGGVQGALILAVSSVGATDPVDSTTYPAGLYGIDPVFGDTFTGVGAAINLNQVAYTRSADVAARTAADNAHQPFMIVDAPEQTTALHMQMLLQGASPDGTRAPQILIGQVAGAALLAPTSTAMAEIQGGTGQIVMKLQPDAANTSILVTSISGDTNSRYFVAGSGATNWGSGSAATDVALQRLSANRLAVSTADLAVHTAGRGLQVAEGSNAKQGTGTLAAGTATIANTSVTASSRILVTGQPGGANRGGLNVTTITAATSFVVTSTNAADTGVFAYEIFEPG